MKSSNRIKCPKCGSDASYRYGRTSNGKIRRLCLICDRQYVLDNKWEETPNRPFCEACNKPMHVYARHTDFIRFRCSNYPECKQYVKVSLVKLK
jgi:ssDNA-binding Zn-finger/Zn-ribbon topoisomerase 1